MKYTVKFYPERRKNKTSGQIEDKNVPLILSISYVGNRLLYYTRFRINAVQWEADKQRMRRNNIAPNGDTSTVFNAGLSGIEAAVNNLFNFYEAAKTIPSTELLRRDLDDAIKDKKRNDEQSEETKIDFFGSFENYILTARLSEGRRKHYKSTLNRLREFNPFATLEIITPDFLNRFRNHLQYVQNQGRNTYIGELKRFRAFLSHLVKNGQLERNPFQSFKMDAETYGEPVYITIAERDALFFANLPNERLARVRDMFLLQCYIGCRVGDFVKLTHKNIIDGCIEYIAGKTKDDKPRIARVPLAAKALEIINRYNLPNGDLLPYISGQKYNDYIKELFETVGIIRPVTILDPKTRQNIVLPISEVASSHMARRVFVGSLHSKVKNEVIASMSGHVENSRAFSRYYKIEKEDQINAIKYLEQ